MNRGQSQDDAIHEGIDAQAKQNSGDDWLRDHERNYATRQHVDCGGNQRDQEMKEQTKECGLDSAIAGRRPERSSRDLSKNHRR